LDAEQEEDVWACRFSSNGDGLVHELFVQMHESEFANPLSCRKPDTERVPQFRLLSYAVRGAVPA